MIEKIGQEFYRYVSTPDPIVIDFVSTMLPVKGEVVFYEIGVGIGATTLAVANILENKGKILLFSYEDEIKELKSDLEHLGFNNIDGGWGSPRCTYSGYHFELAQGYIAEKLPGFDVAYIDGGHVFHLDAPAACVLKELCNPGGVMLFDDWRWSIAKSPSLKPENNPSIVELYDANQIRACHIQMVCKVIMDSDGRFEFLGVKEDTAIYRRKA